MLTAEQMQAREAYKEGITAFRARDFETASAAFGRAHTLDPAPILLFNLARCAEELGDGPKAIEYYTRYLEESDAKGIPIDDRAEVERSIRLIRVGLARQPEEQTPRPDIKPVPELPPTVVSAPVERASSTRLMPYAITAWSVAAVGAGVAIWQGLEARDLETQHQEAQTGALKASTQSDGETAALNSNVAWGVAGVLVVTGTVLWLLDEDESEPAGVVVAPLGTDLQGGYFGWRGVW
ncbi:MAG: tetratricopeptide repeat protein [Bradymonadia bacterium]